MRRLALTLLFSCLIICIGQAQTDTLLFPKNATLPHTFVKAIERQTAEYFRLFERDSTKTKNYPVSFILNKIDNDKNHRYLFLAEYWIAFHYRDIIPALIKRLTNKKLVGLTNSADLIIWERVKAKQMKFYGHGGVSDDDLFTIAGRANRLLTQITGENFGHVSMYSTPKQLKSLQQSWIHWLKTLQEYNNR
jgi:hypothetical protein